MSDVNRRTAMPVHEKYGQLSAWRWEATASTEHAEERTIVALHGVYDSGRCWSTFASRMPSERTIVALDQNAHGKTPLLDGDFRMETLADQAILAIEDMHAEPIILVGHSMGGVVAHLVALERPDLVSQLILDEPAWVAGEVEADDNGFPRMLMGRAQQIKRWSAGELLIDGWNKTRAWDPVDAGTWLDAKLDVDIEFVNRQHNWRTAATPESLTDLRMPFLLVAGDPNLGSVISEECMRRVRAAVPDVNAHRLNASHETRKDRPDEYADLVKEFIEHAD